MTKVSKYFPLFLITILGLFLRALRYENFFGFGHDQDLFSWIAKDIVIDHHVRLIGQETSISGVFIGPLFYYLISLFFFIFHMDPRSANLLTIIVSIVTIISLYYVVGKFFGKTSGLITAFFYSSSLGIAFFDRWVVPTQPTLLWSVWYMYILLSFLKGNFQTLPILAILLSLTWHIHITLLPLFLILPLPVFLYWRSYPQKDFRLETKTIVISLLLFFILTLPLIIFEARHNFQQSKALIHAVSEERHDVKGVARAVKVLDTFSANLSLTIFFSQTQLDSPLAIYAIPVLTFFLFIILRWKSILSKQQFLTLVFWVLIGLVGQFISKRQISGYYFANLNVLLFLILGLFFGFLYSFKKIRSVITLFLIIYALFNVVSLLKLPNLYDNYADRRALIEYIKDDVVSHRYPCIGVNYIADPGVGVGFRYLFWLNNLQIIRPTPGIPVYNIAIPWTHAASKELSYRQGYFGVIIPKPIEIKNSSACGDPKNQFLPLLGFVN